MGDEDFKRVKGSPLPSLFQRREVESAEAVAIREPSREKATSVTGPAWPLKTAKGTDIDATSRARALPPGGTGDPSRLVKSKAFAKGSAEAAAAARMDWDLDFPS